jgi:C4-type Zn-finger protein
MNENIMRALGFNKEVDAVKNGNCPICGEKINMEDFVNEISKREYSISGICQKCQNKIFYLDEN